MTETLTRATMPIHRATPADFVLLFAILILAAAFRLPRLASPLLLDEYSSIELASGRGSAQLDLPADQILQPPDLFSLSGSPPWWHVWTHMEVIYPPLYYLLLRFWMDLFGNSDSAAHAMTVVTSLAAITVLYDAARLLNGRSVAAWAAILMAVSQPQIDYGRQARAYALLLLTALLAADSVIRLEKFGASPRRYIALALSALACLLTHYFSLGAFLGLVIYASIRLHGATRRNTLIALIAAGALFAAIWGPFMWQQRSLFSTSDYTTLFLQNNGPDHLVRSLRQLLTIPALQLSEPRDRMRILSMLMAVLFVLPLFTLRRRPDLLLWVLWLDCTVAVVAGMDLFRKTEHLLYVRYTILAGPAIFVLLPALCTLLSRPRWIPHAIPCAAAVACALAAPDVFHHVETDPHIIVSEMGSRMEPTDLLAFLGTGPDQWDARSQYLVLSRYEHPVPCPIVFLNRPAAGEILARARHSRFVFAFTSGDEPKDYFPDFKIIDARFYVKYGVVWQLRSSSRGG